MIRLRDYHSTDAPRLVELANNENVSRFLVYTFPYPYTMNDALWWITTGSHDNGAKTKVIEYDGAFVGSVGITPQVGWKSHTAEIGYWLGEAFWGRGIATRALKQMTAEAFAEGGWKKLFAPVLAPNRASARVLEKGGFHLEGVFKNEVIKNGQVYDILHYARLRE